MQRKNPFAPEAKTVRSVRNPVLERNVRRASPPEVVDLAGQSGAYPRASDAPTLSPPPPDEIDPETPRPSMPPHAVPRVVADAAFIRVLPLDARDGFLLAHVDGASDLRTLVDVTGMTELEVTSIVEKLLELGVVEVR